MTNWFNYPVTHGYITNYQGANTDTPHYAEDIGTPFHTPLTAPLAGTVETANYQRWGGQIFIQPDDHSFPEYYMYHPDRLEVHAGQHVAAGQEIALSGGENPGFAGAEHPADTQFSSGPHTHIGWFQRYVQTPMGQEPFGPDPSNLLAIAKGGGAGTTNNSAVPASIFNAIEPIAQANQVPDALWETIAQVESGFNVNALGDNGTSYGLFQLHIGGQFPSAYLNNPTALDDPGLNAQYAMPNIAKAWASLGGSFDASSPSWWQAFAAQSGHPGGSPGQSVTDAEAAKLQSNYGQFASGIVPGNPLGSIGTTQAACVAPAWNDFAAWPGYWACQANNTATSVNQSVTGAFMSWLTGAIGPFAMRIGVGIAGLGLIGLGAYEVVHALGANNSATSTPASTPTKQSEDYSAEDAARDERHRKEDAETEQENKSREADVAKSQRKADKEHARKHAKS